MSYVVNAIRETVLDVNFRKVLFTGNKTQLVIMHIPPKGEIGAETHLAVEQVLYFVSGSGVAILDGKEWPIGTGDAVVVTPGTNHNFLNTGSVPLEVLTIYSPPNHIDGRIHVTKTEAEADTADETFGSVQGQKGPLWFRAKTYGFGWVPVGWRGWSLTFLYAASIVALFRVVDFKSDKTGDTLVTVAIPFVFITVLFIVLCYQKGERPGWRWGKK